MCVLRTEEYRARSAPRQPAACVISCCCAAATEGAGVWFRRTRFHRSADPGKLLGPPSSDGSAAPGRGAPRNLQDRMRFPIRSAACLALAVVLGSCSDRSLFTPETATPITVRAASSHMPSVRFSEIHYDNSGTDTGEAIEISAPAGTDLGGWSIVLYNGANGLAYRTTALSGVVGESCTGRGVIVVTYPQDGIQNGSPDGMALVNAAGAVVEFLTYEGTFAAVDGPAAGMTGTDIGVSQVGTTPIGQTLQRTGTGAWTGPTAATFGSCNDEEGDSEPPPPPPPPPPATATFISEIHYDNAGSDAGEAVEIEGVAGTDLTGWRVLLYNGNGGAVYATYELSGTIAASCDGRGVVAINTPGIQNGNPDGIALIDAANAVVEFISYGGAFTAVGGAADGVTSVNIGVSESSTTPVGYSLQRNAAGVWLAPAPATFGACNSGGVTPPPPTSGDIVITELMGDPANAESASWGEWFEVHNRGATPVDLQGWTLASGGSSQPDHVIDESVIVPAGGYVVLGRGADIARNGGVALDYNYFSGSSTTIWLDNSDWLALRNAAGTTVDSVRWTALARGVTKAVRNVGDDNANVDGANWGYSTTTFGAGDYGTPGAPNGTLTSTPPAVRTITFGGRTASDPALPVGFEDQIFATLRDELGNVVATTFTWSSETPALASVDASGIVRALGAGSAVLRATAADGTTSTFTVATRIGVASTTASYLGNAEFGEPADADASDDFIVRRAQYTASYSATRGTPNWVSYNLEATHFGGEDRCDCFTQDPELPASYTRLTTADYTGAGAFHGYGIDRGHMVRSADRTAGSLDNAVTYYFSNVIPQAADQNQGPWAAFEAYLGNRAQAGGEEIYIVTGVAGSMGTLKNEGRIVIPSAVWKVAVILPRNHGLAQIDDWRDAEVIAVLMPNIQGIRNTPWQTFVTTVDAIESVAGYDLLALLPDPMERIIESGTRAPTAAVNGPFSGDEGSAIAMSGSGSSDPDGDALTFRWSFGDGTTATGANVSHTYAQDGSYTVRLVVEDVYGAADTAFTTATVRNVAPVVGTFAGATLLPGETYTASGSFTDPGADDWSATVSYGDGTTGALVLDGNAFALSHTYTAAGSYTVTVRVEDGTDAGTRTATVTVLTAQAALQNLIAAVDGFASAGTLANGAATSLNAKLNAALAQVARGNDATAVNQLNAFLNELSALSGRIDTAAAEQLAREAARIIATLD
jgi:DNA/RNA endonuclease G (NUC1)